MPPAPNTLAGIRAAIAARELTAVEVAERALRDIETQEPRLHAYLSLSRERALTKARAVDEIARRGDPLPPLAGVPVAIKDVISTAGLRTTCASRILENYVPVYDATAVRRLEAAGAVIVGKTNCDEFAMGSSTENSAFGPTHNPHDPDRVPGGSSGGSAATVAAGAVPAALGTDTGGSIRQPAAFCGVLGMLPTYGRVSRYGLVAFASSLDHIGPFARTAADCAALMQVIAGRDPLDSTSADQPVPDYAAEMDRPLRGLRVGIPREAFPPELHSGVAEVTRAAISRLEKLGCEPVELSLAHANHAIAIYYLVATAEASANLARFDGVRYGLRQPEPVLGDMYRATRNRGFGDEVKRRILLGTYALSSGYYDAYYKKAQQVRALLTREFREAFQRVDLILTPTTPTPAFRIGEKSADPLALYLADIYTVPASLAGVPGISIPCGQTTGLPVGLQAIAPPFEEGRLLRLAHHFESA